MEDILQNKEFKNDKIFWCKHCINMSTRPRITFNSDGLCNACEWAEEKKKIDWNERKKIFDKEISQNKSLKKKYPELNKREIEEIIDVFSQTITKGLKQGRKIILKGWGTFFVKRIKAKYNALNPRSKELIYVPEKNKVRFRPSKKLKKFINE